jgi:hypothetical protein
MKCAHSVHDKATVVVGIILLHLKAKRHGAPGVAHVIQCIQAAAKVFTS